MSGGSQPRAVALAGILAGLAGAATAAATQVSLVSKVPPGLVSDTAGGGSGPGDLSRDGRYLVFLSEATHLVPGQVDDNLRSDVFLYDRTTGAVTLVSHVPGSAVTTGDGECWIPSISDDGRYVAFRSEATNLVPGQVDADPNARLDAFLYDRMTGAVTLVSHAAASTVTAGNAGIDWLEISDDGGFIVFSSGSTDLVPGQSGSAWQVFLYDRAAGTNTLVSHAAGSPAAGGNGHSGGPVLSADGRWVAYASDATDLIAGGSGAPGTNVFLYDRTTGANTLVSHQHAAVGAGGNAASSGPLISAGGRFISYTSQAKDLVPGQSGALSEYDVFLYDRETGGNVLVSHGAAGDDSAESGFHDLSDDGAWVVFRSASSTMVPGQDDRNGEVDVFLYERTTGAISLVSHVPGSAAVTGNQYSEGARISGDGRYVAFNSPAADLVAGMIHPDPGSVKNNLFLYDRTSGTITLVSHAAGSAVTSGNGDSRGPRLSFDGGVIAFASFASDLVAGKLDGNGTVDVLVHDRTAATTVFASLHAPGSPSLSANAHSRTSPESSPSVSADGRWIAFLSIAGNLVPGQVSGSFEYDLFLHDRETGTTLLVNHKPGLPAASGNAATSLPVVSADGRYVAFLSAATDLVAGQADANGGPDLFLFDRETDTTLLVSHKASSPSTAGNGGADLPAISADGRYVAFQSTATDLASGQIDGNAGSDVFLFDRETGGVQLVSHAAGATSTAGAGPSIQPVLSADGARLAFNSAATDLVAGQADGNGAMDLFLFDVAAGTTALASHVPGSGATAGNGATGGRAALSAGGAWVAFASAATDLAAGTADANGAADLFLFERATGAVTLLTRSAAGPAATADGESSNPWIDADGAWIAFDSLAGDLVPGQAHTPGAREAFVHGRAAATTRLVSHVAGSPTTGAGSGSRVSGISADGAYITFASTAANIVAGQLSSGSLFLHDREAGTSSLVSRSLGSPLLDAGGHLAVLSADGSAVAFTSASPDLVANDFNLSGDAFVYENGLKGRFYTLAPCRLLDTRQPQDGPALTSGDAALLTLHGGCGVPETAKAVAVNVTVTQATGPGHLTFHAGDAALPATSTINFGAGQTRANNAVLRLAGNATGTLAISPAVAGDGTVHLLLDVVGYFE